MNLSYDRDLFLRADDKQRSDLLVMPRWPLKTAIQYALAIASTWGRPIGQSLYTRAVASIGHGLDGVLEPVLNDYLVDRASFIRWALASGYRLHPQVEVLAEAREDGSDTFGRFSFEKSPQKAEPHGNAENADSRWVSIIDAANEVLKQDEVRTYRTKMGKPAHVRVAAVIVSNWNYFADRYEIGQKLSLDTVKRRLGKCGFTEKKDGVLYYDYPKM